MLEETVREWTEDWMAEGCEQGLKQGRAQGLEQERALLCRQAARKFDADAGRRLASALAGVGDAERLAEVGDWIIECGTAADLLARVARFGSSPLRLEEELPERVREWTAAEGREQGLKQGRAQGLEQECALLCRQAAWKFDDAAGRRLVSALAEVGDAERLEDVRAMLEERVREWTAGWVAEGRKQGLKRGRAQGLEQERALLCRQAVRKFDDAAGRRLASALAGVGDAERLAEVGDWIIECGTAADLLARVARSRSSLLQLEELRTMLAERVYKWTVAQVAEGREQGLEQGLKQGLEQGLKQGREQGLKRGRAQGLEQERALLCRQAARKFDADAGRRLASALAGVGDAERLAEVGDWIIECGTAADLLARVARSGS